MLDIYKLFMNSDKDIQFYCLMCKQETVWEIRSRVLGTWKAYTCQECITWATAYCNQISKYNLDEVRSISFENGSNHEWLISLSAVLSGDGIVKNFTLKIKDDSLNQIKNFPKNHVITQSGNWIDSISQENFPYFTELILNRELIS